MKHKFDPTILRSYDIRGKFGKTLNTDDAFAIGAGFGDQIKSLQRDILPLDGMDAFHLPFWQRL